MPIRKIWRESQRRFFFILAALLLVTGAAVFYNAKAEKIVIESKDFHQAGVRTITGPLFLFWGFSAMFLGLGGLLWEAGGWVCGLHLVLAGQQNQVVSLSFPKWRSSIDGCGA